MFDGITESVSDRPIIAFEALILLDYLGTLSRAAVESGRRLVVLENESNGVVGTGSCQI